MQSLDPFSFYGGTALAFFPGLAIFLLYLAIRKRDRDANMLLFMASVFFLLSILVFPWHRWSNDGSYEKHELGILSSGSSIIDYSSEGTFETMEPVRKTKTVNGNINMGSVTLKRAEDGQFFSAMVIPFREIQVGTVVKIAAVEYRQEPTELKEFLIVK